MVKEKVINIIGSQWIDWEKATKNPIYELDLISRTNLLIYQLLFIPLLLSFVAWNPKLVPPNSFVIILCNDFSDVTFLDCPLIFSCHSFAKSAMALLYNNSNSKNITLFYSFPVNKTGPIKWSRRSRFIVNSTRHEIDSDIITDCLLSWHCHEAKLKTLSWETLNVVTSLRPLTDVRTGSLCLLSASLHCRKFRVTRQTSILVAKITNFVDFFGLFACCKGSWRMFHPISLEKGLWSHWEIL